MTFDQALIQLKAGWKIRLNYWQPDEFLMLIKSGIVDQNGHELVWNSGHLLSDDWEVVEG